VKNGLTVTLHYIRKLFIVNCLSKSNLKDHYGDTVMKQFPGKIAEINEFFSFRRNVSDEADRTSAGRLFQSRGLAVANDRSPTVTHRDGRTSRRLEVDERR